MTEQLAHQKFRTLLQVAADQALRPEEQMTLDSHLLECSDCRMYAQSLNQLQEQLRRVMQQQWNVRGKPVSVEAVKTRAHKTMMPNHFAAAFGRFAFIPMLALTIFMVLTIKTTNPQNTSPGLGVTLSGTPSMALIIPKPPSSGTVSRQHTQTCNAINYNAQENETLSSIAIKFGVAKESIAARNGLSADRLDAPQTLVIPICEHATPESTTTPTTPNTMSAPFEAPANPSPRG